MGCLRLSIVALPLQPPYETRFYVDCICCVVRKMPVGRGHPYCWLLGGCHRGKGQVLHQPTAINFLHSVNPVPENDVTQANIKILKNGQIDVKGEPYHKFFNIHPS